MSNTNQEAVAYVRVSTPGQQENGHGMAEQRAAINDYASRTGLGISNWFEEAASGRGKDNLRRRPVLQEAIGIARRRGLPIVVSDLSRLSRETVTLEEIVRFGIEIVSVTEGRFDDVTFGARAAQAQARGQVISETTRRGLQVAKHRGVKLGNQKNLAEAQRKGADSNKDRSVKKAQEIADALNNHPAGEAITAPEAVRYLNEIGIRTGREQEWTINAIRRPLRTAIGFLRQQRLNRQRDHPLYGMFG